MEIEELQFIARLSLAPILFGAAALMYFAARPSAESRLLALFLAVSAFRPLAGLSFLFPDDRQMAAALDEWGVSLNLLSWNVFAAFVWFYPRRLRARSLHGAAFLVLAGLLAIATLARFIAREPSADFVANVSGMPLQIMLALGCLSALARVRGLDDTTRRVTQALVPALILSPFTATGSYSVAALATIARGGVGSLALPEGWLDTSIFVLWLAIPFTLVAYLSLRERSHMALGLLGAGALMGSFGAAGISTAGVFTLAFALRAIVPIHLGQRYGAFGLQRPRGAAAYVLPAIMAVLLFILVNALVISIVPDSPFTAPLGVLFGALVGGIAAAVVLPGASWQGAPAPRENDGLLLGRYRVLRRLGEGGQGVSELCHDERLHRDVVVKTLRVASGEALREARALARVRQTNGITVLDAEERAGTVHIVMEFLERGSLRARLTREGALAPREAARVLDDILAGLEACHAAGVVHRDVKPENVLLTRDGGAKLADFGLARESAAHATLVGAIGTLAYMSPEQLRGAPADARTDVYAAGIVLAEMLAGGPPRAPVDAFEAREIGRRGMRRVPVVDAAAPFAQIVARATAHHADERFTSVADMRAALAEAVARLTLATRVDDEHHEPDRDGEPEKRRHHE